MSVKEFDGSFLSVSVTAVISLDARTVIVRKGAGVSVASGSADTLGASEASGEVEGSTLGSELIAGALK